MVTEEMQIMAMENTNYSLEKYVYVRTSLDREPGVISRKCVWMA